MHQIGKGGIVNIEFDRNGEESLEDFVDHMKMTFITDLHTDNGIYKYNYDRTEYNHTFGSVYSMFKGETPIVKLECSYKQIKIHAYVEIMDIKFFK